jgi:DNA replication protein DnaC
LLFRSSPPRAFGGCCCYHHGRMEEAAISCPACNDTGWLVVEGTLRAKPCECQLRQRKRQRTESAVIPKRYLHCKLSSFRDRGDVSLASARNEISGYAASWPPSEGEGLLLMGRCGVGKTHLAVGVLLDIIEKDKPGKLLFTNFQDLIQQIHASFSSDEAPSKAEILAPVLQADLLVLDELGSQKPTPFVQEMLYYIINSRYNEQRATIFTTNYFDESRREKDETLDGRIGERLRSRLWEMTQRIIITSEEDYRRSLGRRI